MSQLAATYAYSLSRTPTKITTATTAKSTAVPIKAAWYPANMAVAASAAGPANSGPNAVRLTIAAVPNEAPTYMSVLMTALPCWITSLESELMPHVFEGVDTHCQPMVSTK